MYLNNHQIIGRLGRDPELRHLEDGTAVATFSVATGRKYTNRDTGEVKETTEWHNVVVWRGLAEIADKYLKKGALVYISGPSVTRSWEDESGQKKYRTELVGKVLQMGPKSSAADTGPPADHPEHSAQEQQAPAPEPIGVEGEDEDLPF